MKSFRFVSVVVESGKPDVHLMLIEPARDAFLQKAIKTSRVMTVHQSRGMADYGTVGFEKNASGQILIFPKSLETFEGARIIGVKYELLDGAPSDPTRRHVSKLVPNAKKRKVRTRASKEINPPPHKLVDFPKTEPGEDEEEAEIDLKAGVRHAMQMLEEGKQVAAFNLLKRLVA
jgi:hypothetical protein